MTISQSIGDPSNWDAKNRDADVLRNEPRDKLTKSKSETLAPQRLIMWKQCDRKPEQECDQHEPSIVAVPPGLLECASNAFPRSVGSRRAFARLLPKSQRQNRRKEKHQARKDKYINEMRSSTV